MRGAAARAGGHGHLQPLWVPTRLLGWAPAHPACLLLGRPVHMGVIEQGCSATFFSDDGIEDWFWSPIEILPSFAGRWGLTLRGRQRRGDGPGGAGGGRVVGEGVFTPRMVQGVKEARVRSVDNAVKKDAALKKNFFFQFV